MPKTPQLQKLYDYIRKSNTRFKKMSRDEKKVQIAKDVIQQLDMKRMKACSTYFKNAIVEKEVTELQLGNKGNKVQFRELLKKMPTCEVCGVGSVFIATVDRLNQLSVEELNDRGYGLADKNVMVEYEAKMGIFNPDELLLIEQCFEQHNTFCPDKEFPKKRLRRIMNKIIETKGKVTKEAFGLLTTHGITTTYI